MKPVSVERGAKGHGPKNSGPKNRWERVLHELEREPRSWLVTGAAGFVGSHIVETLLRLGQTVRGLDDLSTGRRANLFDVEDLVGARFWSNFDFVEGDVRDAETCQRVAAGCDTILHQAALASVPRSISDPARVHAVNVEGFARVLEAAERAGCRRVVYASSSSIYGGEGGWPQSEDAPANVRSPYAASKWIGELMASTWGKGISTIGLRYFNLFGPRQSPSGPYAAVIPRWLEAHANGTAPLIHGDGEQLRDFTPVQDAVRANLLAACAALETTGVFNCGRGDAISLLELESHLRQLWSTHRSPGPPARHTDRRNGDVRRSRADLTRIRQEVGYAPQGTLMEALSTTVAWYAYRLREHDRDPLAPSESASATLP